MNQRLQTSHPSVVAGDVVVDEHTMFLDDKDSMSLRANGVFEAQETELIKRKVEPGDVVLDLGANIGYYTLILARLVGPEGKVYAFEPDPTNFALLEKNLRANGYENVELVQKAVSNKNKKLRLYLSEENRGDHRLYDSHDGRAFVEVESVRLDDYFQGYGGRVDFIKMDIQGSEGGALLGMTDLLQNHRDVKILSEFWPVGLKRFGIDPLYYLQLLQQHGFTVYDLQSGGEKMEPVMAEELLKIYTPEKENFTNLWCLS